MLIIVFAMLSSCGKKTDWDIYALKGKVKTYVENYYEPEIKFGEWKQGEAAEYGNYSVNFDDEGTYQRMDYLDKNGELTERAIPKWDNGKIIEEVTYDKDGAFKSETKYTYISDSKLEFTNYDEDGNIKVQGTTFLEDHRIVRRDHKIFTNGKVTYEIRVNYECNEKGHVSSMKQTDEDGKITISKFEYLEFDDQNNWTKRLDYLGDDSKTPTKIVIRTYDYYEN